MSHIRRYFTVPIPYAEIAHTYDVCIGTPETQRECNDNSQLFVKATQELIDSKVNSGIPFNVIFPEGSVEYDESQIRNLLLTPDWIPSE